MTRPEAPARTDSFRPVLGAAVVLVFALLAIAALKSSRDLEAARARERLLESRIAETRVRSERLRLRIDRLRHDPGMLERLAREELGMVRPGDVVLQLPDPHLPGPPLPTPPDTPHRERRENGKIPTPAAGSGGQPPSPPAALPFREPG